MMQLIETEVSISPCHWSLTKLEGNPVDLIEDIFEATNMLNKYFACLHIASLIKPWLPSNIIQTYRAPKTRSTVQKKTTQVKRFLFHPSGTTAKWMGWIIPNPGISGSEPFILSRSIKCLPETHADLLVEW